MRSAVFVLTFTIAAACLLACGCGKRGQVTVPELRSGAVDVAGTADAQELERELIAEFGRLYPDAEKRAAELMRPDATVIDDLTSELITEDELGHPLDPPRVRLTFTASNYADYNNDGAVNIADITPLAQRYGMEYDLAPEPDELLGERTILGHPDTRHNRLVAGADGSGDGEVDIADITPIAINYNSELAGYNIYRAEVVDSLLTFSEVPLPNLLDGASGLTVALAEWANVEESQSGLRAGVAGRYIITLETEAPPAGEVFGFRAHAFGDDEEGPPGNVDTVSTPAEEDTVPPYWIDTVGVTSTLALDEGVEVSWGAAYDAKTPPVHYRIYYSAGTELDWGIATVIDGVASPYAIYGLTTLEPYTFAVRAYDSSPAQNLELNTVTRTEYPGPRDIYPPEWNYGEGCSAVVVDGNRFYVTWPRVTDYHEEDGHIFESNPVLYTVYYSTEFPLDTEAAEKVVVEDYDMSSLYTEITDVVPDVRYYFLVRASDSAIIPNADGNDVVCSGKTHEIVSSTVVSNEEELEYRDSQIFMEPSGIIGFYVLFDCSGGPNLGVALRTFKQQGDVWTDELLFEPTEGRSVNEFSAVRDGSGVYHLAVYASDVFSAPILYYLTWDGVELATETYENGRHFCGISIALRDDGIVGFAYSPPSVFPGPAVYTYYLEYENGEWREELVYSGVEALHVENLLAYDESNEPLVFACHADMGTALFSRNGDSWQVVVSDDDIYPEEFRRGTLVQQDFAVYVAAWSFSSSAEYVYRVNAQGEFSKEFIIPFWLVSLRFIVLPGEHVIGMGGIRLNTTESSRNVYLGSAVSDGWLDLVYLGDSDDRLVPKGIRNPVIGGDGSLYYSYLQDRRSIGEESVLLKVDKILP